MRYKILQLIIKVQRLNKILYFNFDIEQLGRVLGKYEDKSLNYYTDGNASKMILSDPTSELLKGLADMVS